MQYLEDRDTYIQELQDQRSQLEFRIKAIKEEGRQHDAVKAKFVANPLMDANFHISRSSH